MPCATALVVAGDQIAWIGSDEAAAAHADGVDAVVDLDGALVSPAFVDAHVHTSSTGLALRGVDLTEVQSLDEALGKIEDAARRRRGRAGLRPRLGRGRLAARAPPPDSPGARSGDLRRRGLLPTSGRPLGGDLLGPGGSVRRPPPCPAGTRAVW